MIGNSDSPRQLSREVVQRDLGRGIERLRRRRRWSQAALADRLNVTRHCIGKWERGLHSPSLEDVVALLAVLEVTFEELVLGRPAPEPRIPAAQRSEVAMCLNDFLKAIRPLLGAPSGKGKEKE